MKLDFKDKFTLEIPNEDGTEDIIDGTIRELTKPEKKELKALYKEDEENAIKLKKVAKSAERFAYDFEKKKDTLSDEKLKQYYDKQDEYEKQIEELTALVDKENLITRALRFRFDKTIQSSQKEKLKDICETYGYEKVFETITKDIEEKKPKE